MNAIPNAELLRSLTYARRYARALLGSQKGGDALVADALRAGLPALPPQLAVYAGVSRMVKPEMIAGDLDLTQRQLLLLTSLEDLSIGEAAQVLDIPLEQAEVTLQAGRDALRKATATDVLVIEDEPIIAMDLRNLVEACGHRVVGVASSEKEAVRLATTLRPGLILADVNLGAGGDGINAVESIQTSLKAPVIFVTAYPERLLTAQQVEPAFIISKPFEPVALAIATYQAVSSTVPLT
ncbi:response regulator [Acetobacteraceae bacterium H6797]|nr:response regulator [Acetobacteraceae bacterium H6797]